MKIAVIVNEFPSLSETFVLNQITGFIDRGHEVDIFADQPQNNAVMHGSVSDYRLLERTRYWTRPSRNVVRRMSEAIRILFTYCLKNPRLLVKSLDVTKFGKSALSMRLLYDAETVWGGANGYEVILCHFGPNGIRGMQLREVGVFNGVLATVFHGYDLTSYLKKRGARIYERLFEEGDLFLPISDYWRNRLLDLGCDKEKIVVHRMGVDCKQFRFLSRHLRPGEKVRILSVARLVEKKGIEYGIRALARLFVENSNVEYTVVGDGPLRPDLENLVKTMGVQHAVKIVGWKDQSEVLEVCNGAHIFLAPSITSHDGDQEGIPVVLMEAMAMGLPVVSTLHSGIPELVRDGTTGFLVPEKDPAALAEKLGHLVANPELWPQMGHAGRRVIEEEYNIDVLNERLLSMTEELYRSRSGQVGGPARCESG